MRANFARGMLKAEMGVVTCQGGMGLRYALGMAELVREHVVQRVLRADVRSVDGTARWGGALLWPNPLV